MRDFATSEQSTVREAKVERRLKSRIEELGGLCLKFTSPGLVGVPDRIILYEGQAYFAELKRPKGSVLSEVQKVIHHRFDRRGFKVHVLHNFDEVDELIKEITKNGKNTGSDLQ